MPDYLIKEIKSKFKRFNGIKGYANISKDGDPKVKALYYCKSIVKDDERIVMSWDGKHARNYFIMTESQLSSLIDSNFHLYETLLETTIGKVAFDVDGKPDGKISFLEHIQETKRIILIQFPNAVFQISGSETPTKFSYHIVLSNYKYTDYKKYIIKMKEFALCYPIFDSSIYSSIRYMKCINQSKGYSKDRTPDTRKQLYIEGSPIISKHLITCDFDEECFDFDTLDFTDYLVVKLECDSKKRLDRIEKRKRGVDISNIKPVKNLLPIEFSYFNATALEKFKILPSMDSEKLDHNIIMQILWWSKHHKLSFEDFWIWNATKEDTPLRKKRYQEYWTGKQYYVDNKFLDNLLELYYPKIKSKYPLHRYKRYVSGIDQFINKNIPCNNYISSEDISDNCKTDILTVGCGVGKTKASIDYVKKDLLKRVLVIIPRITLSYDICERFKHAGVEIANYKEAEYSTFGSIRQLVSASSLYKLNNEAFYDIIICDEFETMIDQFLSRQQWKSFVRKLGQVKGFSDKG